MFPRCLGDYGLGGKTLYLVLCPVLDRTLFWIISKRWFILVPYFLLGKEDCWSRGGLSFVTSFKEKRGGIGPIWDYPIGLRGELI